MHDFYTNANSGIRLLAHIFPLIVLILMSLGLKLYQIVINFGKVVPDPPSRFVRIAKWVLVFATIIVLVSMYFTTGSFPEPDE